MAQNPREATTIEARIAEIERRTGACIATAIVARCDAYIELPWKAFALGASFAALVTVMADLLASGWSAPRIALWHAMAILGVGAACALAAVWVPAWARLFLRPGRRDVEVRQYAQALFLTRELFATPRRTGLLILVSRFERKVQILPDTGFGERVSAAEWRAVVTRMTPALRAGHPSQALQDGLDAVEELLARKGFAAAADGEVPR
jgi:putative membrane protein